MYVIKNATVYTMSRRGVVKKDIRLKDGKIVEIGNNLRARAGEKTINAKGKIVTPGFVDAHSHLGGFEVNGAGEDLNEITNPLTPELDAYYGVNPKSDDFKAAIAQGITTSCLVPGSANIVGGLGMIMKSAGKERLLKRAAVLKGAMGINPKGCYAPMNRAPMTRMAIANMHRDYLRRVKEYMEKKEAAGDDKEKMPPYDLGLEHGIPVLKKEIAYKIHSYMHDSMTVLELAKEFDILITIDHALGASDYLEELTDKHVKGIIYGPTAEPLFPGEGGKLDYEACVELDKRGVKVACMTDGPVSPKNMLLFEIGECIRRGMSPVRALAMITSNAAKIVDVFDRVGSIEVGKDADLLIWSDVPMVATDAVLEKVFIDGELINV